MSSVLVAIRRLRDDWIAALAIALVVFVTATVFALAPRILERVGDDALRGVVQEALAFDRNVAIIEEQPIRPGSAADPLSEIDGEGERLAARLPTSVRALVASTSTVVDSARWQLTNDTPDPTYVRFRIQPGAETRLHYVAGRAPTAAVTTIDLPPMPPVAGEEPQRTARTIEVAIASEAVTRTAAALGDTIIVKLDFRDPLVNGERNAYAAMTIVGTFAIDDPADPFWYEDRSLERVSFRTIGGDSLFVDLTALIATDAYEPMMGIVGDDITPARTTWRMFVDPARLRAADLDVLVRDLRKVDTIYPRGQQLSRASETPLLQSGLLPLVQTHRARWVSALAILTVLAIGPAAVALGTLLLIAAIAARRRRPALTLVRGRGGTLGQLVRAVGFEAAVLAIPTSALAIGVAALAIPAERIQATIMGAAFVAVAAIALLVITGVGGVTSLAAGSRDSAQDAGIPARRSLRRIVFDVLIVVAAASGAYLLRERGVSGASSTGAIGGADPLIAAVPALAGLAVGLAAIRLVPLPLRALGSLAAAGRGLVGMLAFRRASGDGTTGQLLIVLLVVASIGTFASTALVHLDRSGAASSWQSVGAPFRVVSTAGALPRAMDPTTLPGVRSSASDFQALVAFGPSRLRVQLNAVDVRPYEAIVAGSPGDPHLPPEMLGPAPAVLPVMISSSLAARPDGVKLGDQFDIAVDAFRFTVRVAAVRDAIAGFPTTGVFAVISREQLLEQQPELHLAPAVLFLDAPADAGPAIRAAVTAVTPAARVESRVELERSFTNSPVTAAILAGVVISSAIAALYAALAVASALAMAGAVRAVETAKLRTMGLSSRQALALSIIEHGPTVVIALIVGTALGLGLFALLEPGLGLDALVGSRVDIPLAADPAEIGLIALGVLAIAVVGIGIAALIQRRGAPVAALRIGTE